MIILLVGHVLVVTHPLVFNCTTIGLMFAERGSLSIFWRFGLWMYLRELLDLW